VRGTQGPCSSAQPNKQSAQHCLLRVAQVSEVSGLREGLIVARRSVPTFFNPQLPAPPTKITAAHVCAPVARCGCDLIRNMWSLALHASEKSQYSSTSTTNVEY
jgi:hypothetical protein